MSGHIISLPQMVSPNIHLNFFLLMGRQRRGTSIDVLIAGGNAENAEGGVMRVPFTVSYDCLDEQNRSMLVREPEYLASVSYAKGDTDFKHSLQFINLGEPKQRLQDYGHLCVQFAAQQGFYARLYLGSPFFVRPELLEEMSRTQAPLTAVHIPSVIIL